MKHDNQTEQNELQLKNLHFDQEKVTEVIVFFQDTVLFEHFLNTLGEHKLIDSVCETYS